VEGETLQARLSKGALPLGRCTPDSVYFEHVGEEEHAA